MVALILFNIFHLYVTFTNFTTYEFLMLEKNKKRKENNTVYYNKDANLEAIGYDTTNYTNNDCNISKEHPYSNSFSYPQPQPVENKGSMYDISLWENWKAVYGSNPLLWFFPVKCRSDNSQWHNGINFKVSQKYQFEVVKSV